MLGNAFGNVFDDRADKRGRRLNDSTVRDSGLGDRGTEGSVPDLLEQSQDAIRETGERESGSEIHELPLEADEADAAEQAQELDLDEDYYR